MTAIATTEFWCPAARGVRGWLLGACVAVCPVFAVADATRPDAAASNLVVSAEYAASGARLRVDYPDGFSHRLDILSCTNLMTPVWAIAAAALDTAGTNTITWIETAPGTPCKFYLVGDHDLDGDADGLSDASESLVYLTDALRPDTDGDGVPDGAEIGRGTDPSDGGNSSIFFFANSELGHDSYDGITGTPIGVHGPKRTLAAANTVAYPGDTIRLSGSASFHEPMLCLGGKSVQIYPVGAVEIRP